MGGAASAAGRQNSCPKDKPSPTKLNIQKFIYRKTASPHKCDKAVFGVLFKEGFFVFVCRGPIVRKLCRVLRVVSRC